MQFDSIDKLTFDMLSLDDKDGLNGKYTIESLSSLSPRLKQDFPLYVIRFTPSRGGRSSDRATLERYSDIDSATDAYQTIIGNMLRKGYGILYAVDERSVKSDLEDVFPHKEKIPYMFCKSHVARLYKKPRITDAFFDKNTVQIVPNGRRVNIYMDINATGDRMFPVMYDNENTYPVSLELDVAVADNMVRNKLSKVVFEAVIDINNCVVLTDVLYWDKPMSGVATGERMELLRKVGVNIDGRCGVSAAIPLKVRDKYRLAEETFTVTPNDSMYHDQASGRYYVGDVKAVQIINASDSTVTFGEPLCDNGRETIMLPKAKPLPILPHSKPTLRQQHAPIVQAPNPFRFSDIGSQAYLVVRDTPTGEQRVLWPINH